MIISDFAIDRRVTTILLSCALIFFGIFALFTMGVDQYPVVDFPSITVTTILPGADPEIMDSDVTDVLEEEIKTLEGIKDIRSVSMEGTSQIVVQFELSKDVDVAAEEVRAKINVAQADLPTDIEPPIVDKLDISSQPIIWIAVMSDGDYRPAADFADKVLRQRLQSIEDVGSIAMTGFQDREIRVWLDPEALEARRLTPSDVANAIRMKHIELPGGRIEQAELEYTIKVKGEYESAAELENLVVFASEGAVVRLHDVATVTDGAEDQRSLARYNGRPAIGLGVRKQSGANTVAVAKKVKSALVALREEAPNGIHLEVASDSSRFIEGNMNDVLLDLCFGAILTSLVMLVFLRNGRLTFISITAIPTSIIGCFMVMNAFGFTINTMTLLAMSLSIGVVIDDAIVVLENIYRNMEQHGLSAMEAARKGTSEVWFAVLASSSTIVAVFVPVAFMKGLIGRFFFEFGLSVAVAVLISLVVSFTLTPMLCSRLLKPSGEHGLLFRTFEKGFESLEKAYSRLLDIGLRRRWITLGVAVGCFVGGLALIPFVGKTFVTDPDDSRFVIRFEFPPGTSIDKTSEEVRKIEDILYAQSEVRSAFLLLGAQGFGVNGGQIDVRLKLPDERDVAQPIVMARLRDRLADELPYALTSIETISPLGSGQRNAALQFIVQGTDIESLNEVATAMLDDLGKLPGLVDLDTDLRMSKPEVKVSINRDFADDLGVDVRTIAQDVNIVYGGLDVATFKDRGNRYDIRLRAQPDARLTPDSLYQLAVRSRTGELVRTPNLIDMEESTGPNSINRYNRSRSFTLFTNLDGTDLATALAATQASADKHIPDESGWATALTGRSDYFVESFVYMLIAIAIAVALIYIIMGSLFESFIHPFTILTSVPLAVIGGIGLLVITNKSLDIFSFIGFIMLIGIVTKNAILLVDFTNQKRAEGMDRDAALRVAGPLRLRPILMTALTTMAAILPIALGFSEGGEQRASMGMAVIGGMFTATFLTLLVVPCVYTVMDDISEFVLRFFFGSSPAEINPENSKEAYEELSPVK